MGLLTNLHGRRRAHDAFSDDPGLWTSSWDAPAEWLLGFLDTGIQMTADLAMTVSAVWAGVTFMGRNMASLPLELRRELGPGKGTQLASDLPLARVIGRQPNDNHTALEYWEMQTGHTLLRGNAYSEIKEGSRSFADQLIPIHPDRVTPERLPDGRILYPVRRDPRVRFGLDRDDRVLTQEEMFHIRGFMSDGLTGISLPAVAARSLGGVVAADTFAARFFKQGASASLIASSDEVLDDEQEKDLHDSISRYLAGLRNVGGVLVIDGKTTISKVGINPQEAQMLATREHGVREVARWLGLNPQILADAGKEPTHASAEVFAQELVKYSLRPFGTRFEQAIDRDLIVPDDVFARFVFRELLRGDMKARSQFDQLAVMTGWKTRNEVRLENDMNPGPEELDEFLQPVNMMQAGDQVAAVSSGNGGGNGARGAAQVESLRARHIVRETMFALELADRVKSRELAAVRDAAKKHATDGKAWAEWLRTFYGNHAAYVSKTMKVPISVAREYVAAQGLALETSDGVDTVVEDWTQTLAPNLAALALGERRGAHHA